MKKDKDVKSKKLKKLDALKNYIIKYNILRKKYKHLLDKISEISEGNSIIDLLDNHKISIDKNNNDNKNINSLKSINKLTQLFKKNIFDINRYIHETNRMVDIFENNSNLIKVLTWNVSWESILGQDRKAWLCRGKIDPDKSECVQNLIKAINHYAPYDFVCLQEMERWEYIKERTVFNGMGSIHHQSEQDKMVTIYDKQKYELIYSIKAEFSYGRPYLITLFKTSNNNNNNYITIINVHMGHGKEHHIDKQTIKIKNELDKQVHDDDIFDKLKLSRVIMMGDFNQDVKYFNFKFGNYKKKLYGQVNKFQKTCCNSPSSKDYTMTIDHVLDSDNSHKLYRVVDLVEEGYSNSVSDHKPILAVL